MTAKSVPEGYHTVTPYITVRNAEKVIDFLKRGLNAQTVHEPLKTPDGKIMHAEVKIGDSIVMLAEECDMMKATPTTLYVYVPDVDRSFEQAQKAGGEVVMKPADMFYGDRSGGVKDPSGNSWMLATHKEDVAPKELAKRAEAHYKQQQKKGAA